MVPSRLFAWSAFTFAALGVSGLAQALPSPGPVWVPASFVGEWMPTDPIFCLNRWTLTGVELFPRYWVFSAEVVRGPPGGINTCVGAQPFVAEGIWYPGWCTYGVVDGIRHAFTFCLGGIPDAPLATRHTWFWGCFPEIYVTFQNMGWVKWCGWGSADLVRLT